MKQATVLIIVAFLVGCTLLPQRYDNNEYELLARLETNVAMINERCDDEAFVESRLSDLEYDARLLHTYTFYTPSNVDVYNIVDILRQDVLEFKHQYEKDEATSTYCNFKTKLFLQKVRSALEAVGQKPRG